MIGKALSTIYLSEHTHHTIVAGCNLCPGCLLDGYVHTYTHQNPFNYAVPMFLWVSRRPSIIYHEEEQVSVSLLLSALRYKWNT